MMTTAHNAIMIMHRIGGVSVYGDTARYLIDGGLAERQPNGEFRLTERGLAYAKREEAWLRLDPTQQPEKGLSDG
jgi:hypothetical protein